MSLQQTGLVMQYWIGCSGFHYKDWKGVFYPDKLPQSKWFEYYSTLFNTLELNVTFYRFPQLKFLENWYDKSKSEFQFSVKAPRLITHYKKFSGTESMLEDFYGTIRSGLKEKLGCVLFQLPTQSAFSLSYLETIVASMDKSFDNVIEFRIADWWNKKVYDLLSSNNISFCGISYPKLPDEIIANMETVYYRFHGVPKLYWSSYDNSFLQKVADTVCHAKKIKNCYLYFNNTASMAAIENGKWLNEYLQLECA